MSPAHDITALTFTVAALTFTARQLDPMLAEAKRHEKDVA